MLQSQGIASNVQFNIQVLNQFLVSISDGDFGHAGHFSHFALSAALSAQHRGDVDDGSGDAGWAAAAGQFLFLSGLDELVSLGFHVSVKPESRTESGNVILRPGGHDLHLQFTNHEAVGATDLFATGSRGLADLVEGSGHTALTAGGVERGGGDAFDRAATNQALVDGFLVVHSGGLTDGLGQLKTAGHAVQFSKGHGEVALGGVAHTAALLPLSHAVKLRAIAGIDGLPGVVFVLPVDVGGQPFVVKHHGHGRTGTSALVALFGGKDTPLGALVDDVVFQHQSTVVADDLTTGLVSRERSASTFRALDDVFHLLVIHFYPTRIRIDVRTYLTPFGISIYT